MRLEAGELARVHQLDQALLVLGRPFFALFEQPLQLAHLSPELLGHLPIVVVDTLCGLVLDGPRGHWLGPAQTLELRLGTRAYLEVRVAARQVELVALELGRSIHEWAPAHGTWIIASLESDSPPALTALTR